MREAGHPKPVLRDSLEGEGGERCAGWRARLYTYGRFILLYGKNQHNIGK